MGDISEHFSSREFGGHPSSDLLMLLERIRKDGGGKPLVIVSGIRTPEHNAAVGGARRSMHLFGRAADIKPGVVTPRRAAQLGARGIGIDTSGRWAVHVDTRDPPHAAWRYRPDGTWFSVAWPA